MPSPRRIFILCFACALGFALALLALVYFAIPPLEHAVPAAPPWPAIALWSRGDIVHALFGNPSQQLGGSLAVLLLCALAAALATRVMRKLYRQKETLRSELIRAHDESHQAKAEGQQYRDLLRQVQPLVDELTVRLEALTRRAESAQLLDSDQYDTGRAGKSASLQLQLALETLAGELQQASELSAETLPAAEAMEQRWRPLAERARHAATLLGGLEQLTGKLRRLSLNVALASSRAGNDSGFAALTAEAKDVATEAASATAALAEDLWHLKEMLGNAPASLAALNQHGQRLARHLAQAAELLEEQWPLIDALSSGAGGEESFTLEIAAASRRAGALEAKLRQLVPLHGREEA